MKSYKDEIYKSSSLEELDAVRIKIFGKSGFLSESFKKIKSLPNDQKREVAIKLNIEKKQLLKAIEFKRMSLLKKENNKMMRKEASNITFFDSATQMGAIHPTKRVMDLIIDYFTNMNFSIEDGPLVEDDFHNFEALNLPKYHPARDMQDTFYFKDFFLLRTQTSNIQIRTMSSQSPPIKMISSGSVFRRDFDLTHTPMFHQIEGLVVEKGDMVSFSNLKFILQDFLRYLFGDIRVRFRSSFFPFTEPSAEVDISCIFCKGKGCQVCSKTGWLEILGCGIVNINIFKTVGYKGVSGYAFGIGVERIAMLMYKISDLRSLFENDLRILEQFG